MSLLTEKTHNKLTQVGLTKQQLPRHVAIIMDGNGRWAQARGLPRIEGHRRGVKSVRFVVEECADMGIEQLTLFCLSSENWKRPKSELDKLMGLLEQYLVEERSEIIRQNLRFSTIGQKLGLSTGVLSEIEKSVDCSRNNSGMQLCLALNYGSRAELVDAVKSIAEEVAQGRLHPSKISEEVLASHLYTAGMVDPDLLIRTAGEMRVSNFLLWQISYSEIWVTQKCWPEFRQPELIEAFRGYASRDRRFGGIKG